MSILQRILPFFVFFVLVVASAGAQELGKLPFIPTPQTVVDEMIKLANVRADDFIVDLGSGDGRMVISAAKQKKARGFGVDIDEKLVELSNKNAKEAGVADRAQFFQRDMFKTEIRKADVLMLYLLPDFMNRLRVKILTEMQPGARVVAHDYHMGAWYPDRMVTLTVPEKIAVSGTDKAYLYLWIVPAVVEGAWRLFFNTGGKTQEINVSFQQEYQMLSAAGERDGKSVIIETPTLQGHDISFGLNLDATRYQLNGKVTGDRIEGRAEAGKEALKWLARRIP